MQPEQLAESVAVVLKHALLPLQQRVAVLETRPLTDPALGPLQHAVAALAGDVGDVRERVAVLETRAPVPGPPGANGLHGKDGADGLGFDDLAVEFDGDRTLALRFKRGDVERTFPLTLPFLKYQGVYQEGVPYVCGDVVTWGGSSWHCAAPTITKPHDGSTSWRLMVKHGRDLRGDR